MERQARPLGVKLTLAVLEDLAGGRIVARRQDEEAATWSRRGHGRLSLGPTST